MLAHLLATLFGVVDSVTSPVLDLVKSLLGL